MTPEQVTIQLTAHEHEIGSLKHRTKRVESQVEAINKLTASVESLALSVQQMLREHKARACCAWSAAPPTRHGACVAR